MKNESIGNESKDSTLEKGKQATKQDKPDKTRVTTVTPDNDSGAPGPSNGEKSSNKGQGPSGENL